ncbi:hypothetical protein COO60DRAFT_167776 [Scenedesmus sp. NREL 46B-D3]|nr:hypothetical protein COO60DRAFT_167776 [Scenedesmus sp. NREL 46B-D3]
MQRLLKYHRLNHRLLYLQGSATSHTDLQRAQVHAADAVFIMADKTPGDALEEDLKNSTCCLAIGQFVQAMACSSSISQRQAGAGLLARITRPAWLRQPSCCTAGGPSQSQHHHSTPLMCIQLLLPQSKQRLTSWLQRYAALPEHTPSAAANAAAHSSGASPAPGTAAGAGCASAVQSSPQQQPQQGHPGSNDACSNAARFWQGFAQSLAVVCAAEVSYGLMGAACLAPGVVALLSNLVRTVDPSSLPAPELAQLPAWGHEYLAGAGNELYEVPLLPCHMWGCSVAVITRYLQQHHAAIAIATAGSLPPSSAQPAANSHRGAASAVPTSATNSSQDVAASRQVLGVLGRGGLGGARDCRPLWLAPLDHQVLPGTSLYVIAEDLRVVLDIMQDSPAQFQAWLQQQGKLEQPVQAAERRQQPDQHTPSWLLSPCPTHGLSQPLLQQQQQQAVGSQAAAAEESPAAAEARQLSTTTSPAGAVQVGCPPMGSSSDEARHMRSAHAVAAALTCHAGQQGAHLQQHCKPAAAAASQDVANLAGSTVLDINQLQAQRQQQQQQQQQQPPTSDGGSSTGPPLLGGGGQSMHVSSHSLTALPAAQVDEVHGKLGCLGDSRPGAQHSSSRAQHHAHRRGHSRHPNRQPVRLDTHALAAASHTHVSGAAMALRSRAALQPQAAEQLRQGRCSGRRATFTRPVRCRRSCTTHGSRARVQMCSRWAGPDLNRRRSARANECAASQRAALLQPPAMLQHALHCSSTRLRRMRQVRRSKVCCSPFPKAEAQQRCNRAHASPGLPSSDTRVPLCHTDKPAP